MLNKLKKLFLKKNQPSQELLQKEMELGQRIAQVVSDFNKQFDDVEFFLDVRLEPKIMINAKPKEKKKETLPPFPGLPAEPVESKPQETPNA